MQKTLKRWRQCNYGSKNTHNWGKDHCTEDRLDLTNNENMLFYVCRKSVESKFVKLETSHTGILPPHRWVFSDWSSWYPYISLSHDHFCFLTIRRGRTLYVLDFIRQCKIGKVAQLTGRESFANARWLTYQLCWKTTWSWCYKTFFGGILENLDFPLSWNSKNRPF